MGSAKDAIDKFIAKQEAKDNAAKAFCKDLARKEASAKRILDAAENKCMALNLKTIGFTFGKVAAGIGITKGKTKSSPAYNVCMTKTGVQRLKMEAASKLVAACEKKHDVTIRISDTFKKLKWGAFWLIKAA